MTNSRPYVPDRHKLPEEIPVTTTYRRALAIILIPLMVILLLNLFAARRLDKSTLNMGHAIQKRQWQRLAGLAEPVAWLIVGDSAGRHAVDPDKLQKSLRGPAVNLATNAGMILVEDVWMVESYIKRFGAPENILVVHTYDVWHREMEPAAIAKVPLPWGYWWDFSVSPDLSSRDLFEIAATRFMPLYAENQTIVTGLLTGTSQVDEQINRSLRPDGFSRSDRANSERVKRDIIRHIGFVEAADFAISPENVAALNELVEISQEYDTEIFLINGPMVDELAEDENLQAYYNDMIQALSATDQRSDRFHYLPMLVTFTDEQMSNADHVIYSAAEEYTELIAKELSSYLSLEH